MQDRLENSKNWKKGKIDMQEEQDDLCINLI